jgi:hypothetical protein
MKTAAEAHRVRATENEVAPSERLVVETARRRRAANPTTWLVPIFFGLI